jgi:hypothetical protein
MRFLLSAAAYLVSFVLTAIAATFALFYLVGPHGGVLPSSYYLPVLVLAWVAVIVLPLISARWMWRYVTRLIARGLKS